MPEIGQTISHYRIIEKIGAGGMGEVYRARDSRLGRDVAIKVLPSSFAEDAECLRRFEREARALAALNHPNIVALFDIGFHDGSPYLVSELLEGESLRQTLLQGLLPQRKALEYAAQIARGLAAAHEMGVVHRDLKPENIFLMRDGRIKILDFGLAKLVRAEAAAGAETMTRSDSLTRPGVIMGTAGYMSPEQVRGQPLDHRSDIFSFGAVLYELLSGRRAFARDTAADTMSAILNEDPSGWDETRARLSPGLTRVIEHCLEEEPQNRFHTAHDLCYALEAITGQPTTTATAPAAEAGHSRVAPLKLLVAGASLLLLALGLACGIWWQARRAPAAPRWSGAMLGGPEIAWGPRLSPDGRTLAFLALVDGLTQVAVMNPESGNWMVLTHERSHGLVLSLCWSRDGKKIYFDRLLGVPKGIFTVPPLGGGERLVLDDAIGPEELPDGSLLLTMVNHDRNRQLYRYWPQTGRKEALPALCPPPGRPAISARVFPDGREAAFVGIPAGQPLVAGSQHLYLMDLESGASRRLDTAAPVEVPGPGFFPQLTITPDGRSILTVSRTGDLHEVIEIPRSGGKPRLLYSSVAQVWSANIGPDGSLYLDQKERVSEVVRFAVAGGTPEVLAAGSFGLRFADGRILQLLVLSGRNRLMVAKPGEGAIPFIDTEEQTSWPVALLSPREVVLTIGSGAERMLAVASSDDGRVLRRLNETRGEPIGDGACTRGGDTIYYAAGGKIWAVPAAGGKPRKVTEGDSVACDPHGADLIVQVNDKEGVRLVRVPASGGEPKPILIHGGSPLAPLPVGNPIDNNGRLIVTLAPPDSWHWGPGVLDPVTGELKAISLRYAGSLNHFSWEDSQHLIAGAGRDRGSLWCFRPAR